MHSKLKSSSFRHKTPPSHFSSKTLHPLNLTHKLRRWGVTNISDQQLQVLENLLSEQKTSYPYLKVLQLNEGTTQPKLKRELYPLKEHARCMLKFDYSQGSRVLLQKVVDDQLNEYLAIRKSLRKHAINRDIIAMLKVYKEHSRRSCSQKLSLICCLDEVVIYQFLNQKKQLTRALIKLSDLLVGIKHYEESHKLLQVGLAHAIFNRFVDEQLTIYDKLGITFYYLEKLEQSINFHNYFAEGRSRIDIERGRIMINEEKKQLFSVKFYEALSMPIFNDTTVIPKLESILQEFFKLPQIKGTYCHTLHINPNVRQVGIKSHLSGLRQKISIHTK